MNPLVRRARFPDVDNSPVARGAYTHAPLSLSSGIPRALERSWRLSSAAGRPSPATSSSRAPWGGLTAFISSADEVSR